MADLLPLRRGGRLLIDCRPLIIQCVEGPVWQLG